MTVRQVISQDNVDGDVVLFQGSLEEINRLTPYARYVRADEIVLGPGFNRRSIYSTAGTISSLRASMRNQGYDGLVNAAMGVIMDSDKHFQRELQFIVAGTPIVRLI